MNRDLFAVTGKTLLGSAELPTHVAKSALRLSAVGVDASADTFLMASYLAEIAVKTIGVALQVALRDRAPSHAYRIAYELVRADGLGSWESAIRECTSEPLVGFIAQDCNALIAWATRRRSRPEDEWFRVAKASAGQVLKLLGAPEESSNRPQTARDLVASLVQIRNKTKAHGAVGPDFFAEANEPYVDAVSAVVENCPVFSWQWLHLSLREKGNVRAILLRGEGPQHLRETEANRFKPKQPGVYFLPPEGVRPLFVGDLLRSNREHSRFSLPNGGYDGKGRAEFLDYGTGSTSKEDVSAFIAPPVLPPPSETQGNDRLDVQGNVFANLPPRPRGYVERSALEGELHEKLRDRNHAIVTLHGRGGVGKTMLALTAAHQIAEDNDSRFDTILWFSARDVDLRPGGPTFVRPAVVDLEDISAMYAALTDGKKGIENLAEALRSAPVAAKGTLFVFDNFETMSRIADLHQFLDAHTNLPNKVLITSRERAFKADYPIEVKGMEYDEARRMLVAVARELNIEGVATDTVIRAVYDNTEGHAYLMRVVMGEVAKEGRYVPIKQLVSRRLDIVDAVFERSFEKLSDAGRHVFLVVSNWKSAVPAIALIVVLADLGLDAEAGIDECLRLSLINRDYLEDGQPCYTAPLLARLFGQKKLIGDSDRLVIQAQLSTVRQFGVVDPEFASRRKQSELIERFIDWCCSASGAERPSAEKLDRIFQSLAELWPPAWLALARFRQSNGYPNQQIDQALRRAVEEMPENKDAWLARARFAEVAGDEQAGVAALISAVEADPSDLTLLLDVAGVVTRYINSSQTHPTRRGAYLASVRDHLERFSRQLNADGLSRLSWLYLLEGNTRRARELAEAGLKKDAENSHCWNLINRLPEPES
jgi:tetratricopeptide (TPR) repeat protein